MIVDDSPVQRALFKGLLRSWGHPVTEAVNGIEALELVKRRKIRIVFTDWMMPKLTGVEFIQKVREEPLGFYVYVNLCSGKNSKTDVIEGIRAGADDFLIKPASPEELLARLHAAERVISLQDRIAREEEKLAQAYLALSKAHETLHMDLAAAAKLQISLLPRPASVQKVRFDWVFRPTNGVAGDIFNVFPLDTEHIGFYQLDVSGHGIPSAMLSFSLSKILQSGPFQSSILKRATPQHPFYKIVSPNDVAGELNRMYQNDENMFFTMVYGVLNVFSGKLQFIQAGHPNPILTSRNGSSRQIGGTGYPIAALPSAEFDLFEEQLYPGDRLTLCSDGINECLNDRMEQFGIDRLMDCARVGARGELSSVASVYVEKLLEWRGRDEFDDDVSLLVLEYQGPERICP